MSVDDVLLKEYILFGNIRSIQDPFTFKTCTDFKKIDDVFIIHKWRSHAAWNECSRLASLDRLNIVRLDRFFIKNIEKWAKIVSFNLFPENSFNTISNAFEIHFYICLSNSLPIRYIFHWHHCCHYVKHSLLICTANQWTSFYVMVTLVWNGLI